MKPRRHVSAACRTGSPQPRYAQLSATRRLYLHAPASRRSRSALPPIAWHAVSAAQRRQNVSSMP